MKQPNSREKFRKKLNAYIGAGCSGLCVDTPEIEQLIDDVDTVMSSVGGVTWHWSVTKGLTLIGMPDKEKFLAAAHIAELLKNIEFIPCLKNLAVLHKELRTYAGMELQEFEKTSGTYDPAKDYSVDLPFLLIVENFNFMLETKNPVILQTLIDTVWEGRQARRTILLTGVNISVPPILESLIHKLDRELPDSSIIESIAKEMSAGATAYYDSGSDAYTLMFPETTREDIFRAARGMNEMEVQEAFALAYAESADGIVLPEVVSSHKRKFLAKSSALEFFTSDEGFETLGGLDALKTFLLDSLVRRVNKDIFPKGVVLAGPPGTAKTEIARRLAKEIGVPAVLLSVGKLLDKYVGGSESATATALKVIEALSPCVLVIDEMEKALAGSTGRGTASDGGVMSRTLGTLLTWLQCRTAEVFVIGTCNDMSSLPTELTRPGRFDGVFYSDLPLPSQRSVIWDIYRKKYNIATDDEKPVDLEWTGAEIEQCCRMACMQGKPLKEAANYVIPINRSSSEKINQSREAADGSLIDANFGGPYSIDRYKRLREDEKKIEEELGSIGAKPQKKPRQLVRSAAANTTT